VFWDRLGGRTYPLAQKSRPGVISLTQIGRRTALCCPVSPSPSDYYCFYGRQGRCTLLLQTATRVSGLSAFCIIHLLTHTVFNFFEPLHYFQHNGGFQTWELSPQYAIRSWAYILLHWPFSRAVPYLIELDKVGARPTTLPVVAPRWG
jgi:hypothetical protein